MLLSCFDGICLTAVGSDQSVTQAAEAVSKGVSIEKSIDHAQTGLQDLIKGFMKYGLDPEQKKRGDDRSKPRTAS